MEFGFENFVGTLLILFFGFHWVAAWIEDQKFHFAALPCYVTTTDCVLLAICVFISFFLLCAVCIIAKK